MKKSWLFNNLETGSWLSRASLFLFIFLISSRIQASTYELTLNPEELEVVELYQGYTWSSFLPWSVSESMSSEKFAYSEIINWDSGTNPLGIHLLDIEASNSYVFNFGIVQITPFSLPENQFKQSGGSSGSQLASRSDIESVCSDFGPPDMAIPEATTFGLLVCAIPFIRATLRKSSEKKPL